MSFPNGKSEPVNTPDDLVLPFSAEGLETRGRVVRLGPVVDQILRRHDYPEPVCRVLGEAIVLAAILGTNLKFEGRFILQSKTDGPISMLVVDFQAPDGLRAWRSLMKTRLRRWKASIRKQRIGWAKGISP